MIENVIDLNSTNIWNTEPESVAKLWEAGKSDEEFPGREAKLLNLIRLAFEVVHYNPEDIRDVKKYENGEWTLMTHTNEGMGKIAIKKKVVTRLSDLGTENVKQISAATVVNLIDRNFGGGWDSIPAATREIILTAFDVSSTQLPTTRLHAPGGTLERKLAQGYEVLEVPKGTWTEAIFVKKKEPVEFVFIDDEAAPAATPAKAGLDEDGTADDEAGTAADSAGEDNEADDINDNDDTFYSSYSAEADVKEGEEEGFGGDDEDTEGEDI